MESDALLLGRTTYEGFAEAWPSREGEFADKFNQMPKYVVSDSMGEAEWENSTVIGGRPRRRGREAEGRATTATSSSTAAPPWRRRCSTRASSTSCG